MSVVIPLLGAHTGSHRAPARPRRTLASRARAILAPLMPQACITPPATALLEPAQPVIPFGGPLSERELARVRDAWEQAFGADTWTRAVNGRSLGTQPRQTMPARVRRPGKQPWPTAQQPALYEPEPDGPSPAWADGTGPLVAYDRPYVPAPVYGQAPQLDVDEAERLAGEMLP